MKYHIRKGSSLSWQDTIWLLVWSASVGILIYFIGLGLFWWSV